ncbi:MAG: low molecular weight protein arginine phosphatase [Opitutales bacterium]|nr:low molecular weight protein arginine phosphatase [Opitutales bacterium]
MAENRKVVVACTGNTCRSPMAAHLLRHALAAEEEPLNTLEVVSAGVSAFAGDPPSENAVRALGKVGLDLSPHRSRRFAPELAEGAGVIFVMTEAHRQIIRERFPDIKAPLLLFRELMGGHNAPEVPDPFGGTLTDYIDTRDSLAEAIPSVLRWLREAT